MFAPSSGNGPKELPALNARTAIEAGIATKRRIKAVHEYDPLTGKITKKIGEGEFRFLTSIPLNAEPTPIEPVVTQ